MKTLSSILGFFIFICVIHIECVEKDTTKILDSSLKATEDILNNIYTRWQINEYPHFLKSVAMSQASWNILKFKYEQKIMSALQENVTPKFVISFLGSSVTAGHDSQFNVSFSELTRENMMPAFGEAGIKLEVINGAMGNNPCLPYDVCVKAFAGSEPDMVMWEQSYNCGGSDSSKRDVFEQFVRQSMALKSQPIVLFAGSSTPNWPSKACRTMPPKPSVSEDDDKMLELLKSDPMKIPSEINKGLVNEGFSAVATMFHAYKAAGVQVWDHTRYEKYKCHGPYLKSWQCCSASWHPSLLGHEIRAAHYSYFWLLIYKEALQAVKKKLTEEKNIKLAIQKLQKHRELKYILPPEVMYKTDFSDNMQCLTTFMPRADPDSDFLQFIIKNGDERPPFKREIIENFMDEGIVKKATKQGYKDFKYMMYGNIESSPLSLTINVAKAGIAFMCSPPGNWGKLPPINKIQGKYFWAIDTKVYLSENTSSKFVFNAKDAKLMTYINKNPKDTQTLCVNFVDPFPAGSHVLTIVPTSTNYVMISTVLLP